jgi:putative ABC transport system permease protein
MKTILRIRSMWLSLFRREHVERNLDSEVRTYYNLFEEEKMSQGMNPKDARRAARVELGGTEQLKEEIRSARAGSWLESVWMDLRYAARLLSKNPGFTAVAVLTLALGIGANTAVFSVVNAVVLRPLPYKDSQRLVTVTTNTAMFPNLTLGNSWLAVQKMRKTVPAFEQLTAYSSSDMNMTQSGNPAQLSVISIADGFFDLFGVGPQQGRLLLPSDQTVNQGHVAVLSDALWRSHFGADPGVIGRTITLDKLDYTIVGVASRGFEYPHKSDLWVPLILSAEERTNITSFNRQVVAKLRPGQSIGKAQAEVSVVAHNIADANPALKEGYALRVDSVLNRSIGDVRSTYLMLFGAAGFVLLIACANLASLLLARGWGRQREMAMRAALGATRGRIIRQALVESCLLGLLGGAAGAMLASFGVDVFRKIAPASTPRLSEISPDSAMFWFALGSSLIAGILFGFAPALRASRSDPNAALNDGATGSISGTGSTRQPRLGGALVISEIALAFILLMGAVVTVEGLIKLLKTDTGIRTDHLLTFNLPLPEHENEDTVPLHAKIHEILDRVQAVPGVEAVAATDHPILGGSINMFSGFTVEGAPAAHSLAESSAQVRSVSPSLFQLLGIRLIRGRFFDDHDVQNSQKVVIVNEAMARRLWGTLDVVGKRIQFGNNSNKAKPAEWTVVAGVVASIREVSLGMTPDAEFYFPIYEGGAWSIHLITRTKQDPNALAALISRQVWLVDKDQPITDIATMDQLIKEEVGEPRMHTALLSFFGAIGLGLALLGVYGVVAYSVARRTREIGIRMALGANPSHVLRMVIRQGFVLAAVGVAIGAGGAFALARVLKSQFTVANTTDVPTYLAAATLVIFVACLACYVPARRAMRVDPMVALRHE